MYHDVVPPGAQSLSGISGADADLYKLERLEFNRHLDAIREVGHSVRTCVEAWTGGAPPVFLTFDDGGSSAMWTAEELERRSWRGHFFIVSEWVGKTGFLTEPEVRDLHRRGHVVGSHSRTHPARISALSKAQIAAEWSGSVQALSGMIGGPVTVGSVPGGFYSREVGDAAMEAGIQWLFTSQPTATVAAHGNGWRVGRFFIQQGMGPEIASAFAGGPMLPRLKQALLWDVKKALKAAGGEWYVRVRRALLEHQAN